MCLTQLFFPEYNVSHDLANYMIMVLNPTSGTLVRFLNELPMGPWYSGYLNELGKALEDKLEEHGFTNLSEMFRVLAIE